MERIGRYVWIGLMKVEHDDGDVPQEEILQMVQYDNLNLVVINDSPYFRGR